MKYKMFVIIQKVQNLNNYNNKKIYFDWKLYR